MENHIEILVERETLLADIQKAFNKWYPFLKIEFFGNAANKQLLRSIRLDPGTSLNNLNHGYLDHTINIGLNRTVAEFAHELESMLGVIVQVSRKAGNFWHQISATHWWTLQSQNEAGKIISSEMSNN